MKYYKRQINYKNQMGVSLVEILISMLLLAVAALGYSALQGESLKRTDESLTTTESINLLRSAAEKIRVNGVDAQFLPARVSSGAAAPSSTSILVEYNTLFNQQDAITAPTCTNGCTPKQQAKKDVIELKAAASAIGVKLGMAICPGTDGNDKAKTRCLIAAWKATKATIGDDPEVDCMKSDGEYHATSDCIIMEAY